MLDRIKQKTLSQNNRIFIPKKTFKSHLKAVSEGLNFKIFFVAQTWWVTLFRQIVSLSLTLIIITNLTGLLTSSKMVCSDMITCIAKQCFNKIIWNSDKGPRLRMDVLQMYLYNHWLAPRR